MKKIELPTALVLIATIVCTAVVVVTGPPDIRHELIGAIGVVGTALASILPRLFVPEEK